MKKILKSYAICIGNSMICSGIYAKHNVQILLLFVYTTTH